MRYFLIFTLAFAMACSVNAQVITTIAGNGVPGVTGDGGPATAAELLSVRGIAVDSKGNLYICTFPPSAVFKPHVVRKVNTSGIISTIAGTDTSGFSGDGGPATAARLNYPEKLETDKFGNLYIADRGNNRVRKVDTFGIITTFAGNGSATPSGDGGSATAAGLGFCYGVYCDTAGNVYITAGSKIRKVAPTGIITTIAGTGIPGFSGDGGPATAAQLFGQGQIVMDKHGNLFLGDAGNVRVRKISTTGIITTVAGTGMIGSSGDGGPATLASLNTPAGIFVDNCDNLYIAVQLNNKIRVVNGSGVISTFAGSGNPGFSGDGGAAPAAELRAPTGVYIDKTGNIYIADYGNLRVRYIHMDSCRNTVGIATPGHTQVEERLRVWPNPSSGAFSLRLSATVNETAEVVVTNVVGEVVKQFSSATNKDMEVILYTSPGVYFVTVTTASGKWMEKVLIE